MMLLQLPRTVGLAFLLVRVALATPQTFVATTTTKSRSATKVVVTATTGTHPVVTYMPSQDPRYTTVTEKTTTTNQFGAAILILPLGIVWGLVGGGGGVAVPPPPPIGMYSFTSETIAATAQRVLENTLPDTGEDVDGDGDDDDNNGCKTFSMSTCTKTVSYTSESTGWSKITPGEDACVPTETCVLPFGETTTTIDPSVSQWVAATGVPGPTGSIPKPGREVGRVFEDALQQLYKKLGIERDYGIPDPTCQRSKLYAPQRKGDGSPDVSTTFEKWCKEMAGTKVVKAPKGTDTFFNRFGFRDYSFWLSANSRYRSPFECGDETTIDEHECVNTLNEAMITCDPDSGATHGASKDGRCLQYNITLSWSTDDQSPPWNPLPEPQCEGSSSGVYYTFFDALFPKFCQAADDNDDDEFSQTLTNKDIDTEESAADILPGELKKRTPPASPNSYDGYKFHFDWTAHKDGAPCRKSCHRAFQDFADVCGVTGGMEDAMTNQGSIDVDCGVYKYSIEKPPPPPKPSYTTIDAANPTRPVGCYKENTNCTLYDADPDTAHEKTDTFCDDHADYAGHLGWDGIEDSSKDVGQYIGWYFKVEWKKDCKDPARTFLNVGQPIKSYSCKEAFRLAFDGCTDNGGRGGLVEVGCLQYFFNPTDRPDFSHVADSCLNPWGPFE